MRCGERDIWDWGTGEKLRFYLNKYLRALENAGINIIPAHPYLKSSDLTTYRHRATQRFYAQPHIAESGLNIPSINQWFIDEWPEHKTVTRTVGRFTITFLCPKVEELCGTIVVVTLTLKISGITFSR